MIDPSSFMNHRDLQDQVKAFRGGVLGYTVFQRTYAASRNRTQRTHHPVGVDTPTPSNNRSCNNEDEKKDETLSSDIDLETFEECIDRMLSSELIQRYCRFSKQDVDLFRKLLLDQKCSLSGRALQCLGLAQEENSFLPLASCAFVQVSAPIEPFLFAARLSLQGVGVGYSVENKYVRQLPILVPSLEVERVTQPEVTANYTVEMDDPSRETWIRLFHLVLDAHFGISGYANNRFTYSLVGGDSSLNKALETAVTNLCFVLQSRLGLSLRSIDCMDMMNIIAPAVVAGKVRRAALLAMGDASDLDFLRAKRWDLEQPLPMWRSASNNSAVCSDVSALPTEFWDGYAGKGEAMGLVNLDLFRTCGRVGETQYPDPEVTGVSACAEQGLATQEVSCLAELMLPQMETSEQLWEATRLVYTVCKNKFLLPIPSHHSSTKKYKDKHFRMGIGVTGYMQATEEQKAWLSDNYWRLRRYDTAYSKERGLPPSIKLTTIKPSGTTSLLSGNTPGCHPGFASYYIRRVRFNADSLQLAACRALGLLVEEERGWGAAATTTGKFVVEFPCCLPPGTKLAEETSAIDQLEVVRRLQSEWSDSAVSVTVYYRLNELEDIKTWLAENYRDSIKAISFMLHSDHGFDQAPYEKIDEEKYHQLIQRMKGSN